MIPTRRSTAVRRFAGPLLGLTVLLAVPVVAGADEGRGGGKSRDKQTATEEDDTSTSVTSVGTTVTAPTDSTEATTSTSAAITSTTVIAVPTTGSGAKRELVRQLGELIKKIEKSKLATEVRDGLLTRLRAMRDAASNGTLPSEADLKALVRDIGAALQRNSGDGSPTTTTTGSSTTGGSGGGTPTTTTGKRLDPTRIVKQLDEWTAKINASSLSDADKATLLAAIDRLRTLATTGAVTPADLELVKSAVSDTLDRDSDDDEHHDGDHASSTTASDPSASTTPTTDSVPRPKGKAAVDAAIQTVTNSPLPEALKQQILGILGQAKTIIEDPSLTKEQVAEQLRELHQAEHRRRLDEAAAKLTRFSEKIAVLAFQTGSTPGSGDVIVVVHDLLAQANDLLASTTPDLETIKAAWKLLHEARTTLQQFLESASSTTTTAAVTTSAG